MQDLGPAVSGLVQAASLGATNRTTDICRKRQVDFHVYLILQYTMPLKKIKWSLKFDEVSLKPKKCTEFL
jgi:hypothetical protein